MEKKLRKIKLLSRRNIFLFISLFFFHLNTSSSFGEDKKSWQLNNWQLSNSKDGREFYINLKNNTNRYRKFDIETRENGRKIEKIENLVADCLTGKFGPSMDNWWAGTGSKHYRGRKFYSMVYMNYVCYYPYQLNRLQKHDEVMGKVIDDLPHEKTVSIEDANWDLLWTNRSLKWWVDKNSIIRDGDILYFNYSTTDSDPYDPLGKRSFENRLRAELKSKPGLEGNIYGTKINCVDRTVYSQKMVENPKPDPYKERPSYIYLPIEWNPLNESFGYPLYEKIGSLCQN